MTQVPPSYSGSPAPKKKSNTLLIVGIVVAIVLVGCGGLIAVLLPGLARARDTARQRVAANNMKQVGVALMSYASANGDEMPPPDADWRALLGPYGVPSGSPLYSSPAAKTPGAVTVFYMPPEMPVSKIPNPGRTLLLYETPGLYPKGGNIVFASGVVEFVPEPQYSQMVTSLKLRDGKLWSPHLTGK